MIPLNLFPHINSLLMLLSDLPLAYPITRTAKNNNTSLKYTRTGPKLDPNRLKKDPNQHLPESMEVQAEKKRRRDNEKEKKEDSTVIQHFLTAGPGSQACRDQ
jgi:hypothetical protein